MTPDQARIVQETWKQVVPIADAAGELFYRRLFEIDPSTCELFRATDMPAQRRKLLQMLAVAVRGLDNLDALASTVEELGRRHAGYGVTDAHYDSVGAALLWTLQQGLGEAWTPAVAAAWTAAYRIPVGHHAQGRRTHALCPDRSCGVGARSSRRAALADIARALLSLPRSAVTPACSAGPRGSSPRPSPQSSSWARWCCPTRSSA